MSGDVKEQVDPAISAEGLRKAEEYVQQEEGAGNRLTGWAGIIVTGLAVETVPARRFLGEVLQPLAADLRERGIEVAIDLDLDDTLQAALDRDRIQRVLENLFTNARDALAIWGLAKRVAVRATVEGGWLAVRVADSGPGIPAEGAEHLFEPFATTGKTQGTGLGLATVRNLVKAHGGDVRVETKSPEGGAAFTVLLPLASPSALPVAAGRVA